MEDLRINDSIKVPHMKMLDDEKIVTQLVISYINGTLKKPEEVHIDPDPALVGWANEQYHIWYYPNLNDVRYRKHFEMVGWFFIQNRNIEMSLVEKLPWHDVSFKWPGIKHFTFDIADPNQLKMKKILRNAFDKAKRYLKREAKRDK